MWRQVEQLTVPASGNATFRLAGSRPMVLSRMTVWATTGERVLAGNLTFQPRVNGKNLGSSTTVTSTNTVNDVVYSSGGGAGSPDNLIPQASASGDPFNFRVLITNAAGSPVTVTLYALGLDL